MLTAKEAYLETAINAQKYLIICFIVCLHYLVQIFLAKPQS